MSDAPPSARGPAFGSNSGSPITGRYPSGRLWLAAGAPPPRPSRQRESARRRALDALLVLVLALIAIVAGLFVYADTGSGVLSATVVLVFLALYALGSRVLREKGRESGCSDSWTWTENGWLSLRTNGREEAQRTKSMWDFLQSLGIVPAVLALAGVWYSSQLQSADSLASQQAQAQDLVLNSYFDRMQDLFLKNGLSSRNVSLAVRSVAQARTSTALIRLDNARKGILLRFLAESHLIAAVPLRQADLSGASLSAPAHLRIYSADLSHGNFVEADLSGAGLVAADLSSSDLSFVDASGADLSFANLHRAVLLNARLRGTHLGAASLKSAILRGADLTDADISNALMSGADLRGANLSGANLSFAILTGADLTEASLNSVIWRNTTCPDGTNSSSNHTSPESCQGHLRR